MDKRASEKIAGIINKNKKSGQIPRTLIVYGRAHSNIAEMLSKQHPTETAMFRDIHGKPNPGEDNMHVNLLGKKEEAHRQVIQEILQEKISWMMDYGKEELAGKIIEKISTLSEKEIKLLVEKTKGSKNHNELVKSLIYWLERISEKH